MNRKLLCLFFFAIISLEFLVPCANAGMNKKLKKISRSASKGAMETAKGIGKSTLKLGGSLVKTAGHGIGVGVGALGTSVSIGSCPIMCLGCAPEEGIQMVEDSSRYLGRQVVGTVKGGIDVGKNAGVLGKKIATSPCVCGKNTLREMAEIETQEEFAEWVEEEKRRKLKELPESSN
ncbi:uncharacterized protein LOC116347470 [Contarinia nasturtii]|uniref:uncharacterized protein LOC116347470 n=1 Tax=Contarinia nasturtii TaxID=265458 RepID=UPI0012D3FE34|nr:uncharacterized protein LOC116347470 [Contarinia nasturtii]